MPVTVVNETADPVQLKLLTLSCGCLSSDFKPGELAPGQQYHFNVEIFNALLGAGMQHGVIQTDAAENSELVFQVQYQVDPSASLFPDTFLVDDEWLGDGQWPRQVEFEVLDLEASLPLKRPLYLERDPQYGYRSPIQYTLPETMLLEAGGKVTLQLEPGEFQGGSIQDGWIVVAEGEQETMRFPIVVAGTLILEPN